MAELPEDVRALYPFRPNYLSLNGVRMHYVDEGHGPAVILLHGNPTWSFYFRDLILGLRDRYRVIAPDHVGCGLSDKPLPYAYALATHIENLARLIDHLRLPRVALAVHDWGGAIGFGWAVRNPERTSALIVFNTAAFLGGRTPLRIRICRWPIIGEVGIRGLNIFARAATRMACQNRNRMTPAVRRGYLFPYDRFRNRVGILRFVRDIPLHRRVPSYPRLQSIESNLAVLNRHPMTIFWGGRDFCFHDGFLAEWQKRFPRATVHLFADAGHYVVEDAHERILPLMRFFLSENVSAQDRSSRECPVK